MGKYRAYQLEVDTYGKNRVKGEDLLDKIARFKGVESVSVRFIRNHNHKKWMCERFKKSLATETGVVETKHGWGLKDDTGNVVEIFYCPFCGEIL